VQVNSHKTTASELRAKIMTMLLIISMHVASTRALFWREWSDDSGKYIYLRAGNNYARKIVMDLLSMPKPKTKPPVLPIYIHILTDIHCKRLSPLQSSKQTIVWKSYSFAAIRTSIPRATLPALLAGPKILNAS